MWIHFKQWILLYNYIYNLNIQILVVEKQKIFIITLNLTHNLLMSLATLEIRLFYKSASFHLFFDSFTEFVMSIFFQFLFFDYSSVSQNISIFCFSVTEIKKKNNFSYNLFTDNQSRLKTFGGPRQNKNKRPFCIFPWELNDFWLKTLIMQFLSIFGPSLRYKKI